MDTLYYWIFAVAFFASGVLQVYRRKRRENFLWRFLFCVVVFFSFLEVVHRYILESHLLVQFLFWILAFVMLMLLEYICWEISWATALYQSIWAFMMWQLLREIWLGILRGGYHILPKTYWGTALEMLLFFGLGYLLAAFTIAKWIPEDDTRKIGPRQLILAVTIFGTFLILVIRPRNEQVAAEEWQVRYLSQLLLAIILYLQNELFKKNAIRQELAVLNMLWKKEQEQYQLSKENIALINQKCHDLKHQIRIVRQLDKEDQNRYLEEIEDSIRIYEAIVKTGNEVLDTILTEKSLYCKERGIVVSCVADGSQMDFIHTVDLYAILGNVLDNAIEAVEKIQISEKRQIDVLIYRQQNFLVINITNPLEGALTYEEELPVTTKGDRQHHGFGLKSVRYLVKKYDGFLTVGAEDGCFSLKILIPVPAA